MPSYAITGASRGIGFEFVCQLSSQSDNIIFALVRNKATATKLTTLNASNVHVLQADITDKQALKTAAAEVSRITGGGLDVLINNAALTDSPTTHLTLGGYPPERDDQLEQDLRAAFEVNVVGVVYTINAFLPLVRKGGLKKVITLSSGLADVDFTTSAGVPFAAPYSITKAGTNMVVAKYAAEYKNEGIVFLAISPGVVTGGERPSSPAEIVQFFKVLMGKTQKVAPHWKGPITPEESVKLMLQVVNNVTLEQSGDFLSHFGNKQWL